MNKQRKLIYSQRNEVLQGADVHEQVLKYIEPVVASVVTDFVDFSQGDETTVDYATFNKALEQRVLKSGTNFVTPELVGHRNYEKIVSEITEEAIRQYEEKCKFAEENGIDFKETERSLLLNQVDRNWMEHIDNMDILRKGIGLRSIGHADPVIEYRKEGSDMFENMIETIQSNVAVFLCKIDMEEVVERKNAFEEKRIRQVQQRAGLTSNSPCPCGSGKKYKDCCGKRA